MSNPYQDNNIPIIQSLEKQVAGLEKENKELNFLIGQYRDGRTHDEIRESNHRMKEIEALKKENKQLSKDLKRWLKNVGLLA